MTPTTSRPTLGELRGAFEDPSLPVPARLDAARELILMFERSMTEVRERVEAIVAGASRDDDLTAGLYWEYEDLVPVRMLGNFHDLREILEARCPWTYPCPSCGVDLQVASRNALKTLRRLAESSSHKPSSYHYEPFTCQDCREAARTSRQADLDARYAAYRSRLHELKTMPYRQYLQTPEWQERRKARLKAARYACQVCNAKNKTLNVHHRTYARRGDEYARDLIVLCEECHHLFHRNGSLAPHDEDDA